MPELRNNIQSTRVKYLRMFLKLRFSENRISEIFRSQGPGVLGAKIEQMASLT